MFFPHFSADPFNSYSDVFNTLSWCRMNWPRWDGSRRRYPFNTVGLRMAARQLGIQGHCTPDLARIHGVNYVATDRQDDNNVWGQFLRFLSLLLPALLSFAAVLQAVDCFTCYSLWLGVDAFSAVRLHSERCRNPQLFHFISFDLSAGRSLDSWLFFSRKHPADTPLG